jgi:hypothetical protein
MKINPRYYPTIILVTFVLFLLLGFLLGFRPQHEGGRNRGGFLPTEQYVLVGLETPA